MVKKHAIQILILKYEKTQYYNSIIKNYMQWIRFPKSRHFTFLYSTVIFGTKLKTSAHQSGGGTPIKPRYLFYGISHRIYKNLTFTRKNYFIKTCFTIISLEMMCLSKISTPPPSILIISSTIRSSAPRRGLSSERQWILNAAADMDVQSREREVIQGNGIRKDKETGLGKTRKRD